MVAVRTITEDELPAYCEAVEVGFHHVPPEGIAAYRAPVVDIERTYAAFDEGAIVGTASSFATELTVPGGFLPVAGVTAVTVLATHTRRGVLTEMMRQLLDTVPEPAAILIAAEAPIYGRFGYGPATEHVQLVVDVPMVRFLHRPNDAGSVRRCSATELVELGPAIYEAHRRATPGSILRKAIWWDRTLVNRAPGESDQPGLEKPDQFYVVHRDVDGTPDGFAIYTVKQKWDHRISRCSMDLHALVSTTDDAYLALWHHCCHVDWVTRIDAGDRPPLEPLGRMLYDQRAARQQHRSDFVWVCVRDIQACLTARRYRVDDALVLEVTGSGRVRIEGGPDGATCEPTTAAPDLTLSNRDLGAAYLGGTPLWTSAAAGFVTEHRAGAVAAFDRMFLTDAAPWCNTWF